MNTVKSVINDKVTTLGNVLVSSETAFIGTCGTGPAHSLYLIVFDKIALANKPYTTWNTLGCPVTVDRYVDIEITVKEKK